MIPSNSTYRHLPIAFPFVFSHQLGLASFMRLLSPSRFPIPSRSLCFFPHLSLTFCSRIQIQTLTTMGGEAKVTVMLLKADLQCAKCYKKVKKVLCKLPQIRNQVYDEKANTVIITVVCCSPEKIRDKICSKGGGSIKSIEIKEQEKKPDKPKEADKKPDKPKDLEKKSDKPKEAAAEKPKEGGKKADKPKEGDKPKGGEAAKRPPEAAPVPAAAAAITAIPAAYVAPMGCTCSDCYHAYGGGPCFQAYGTPIPYGRPVYDSWGSGGGGYRYKASYGCGGYEYFTEENPQSCSIM